MEESRSLAGLTRAHCQGERPAQLLIPGCPSLRYTRTYCPLFVLPFPAFPSLGPWFHLMSTALGEALACNLDICFAHPRFYELLRRVTGH